MNIKDKLARLGISGNLYKVYCAVMEQKEATVSALASRAGLPRATTYDAVLRLQEHGLVELGGTERKRTVTAVNPGVLLEQIAAKRQLITDLLPELQSLHNQITGKPQMRFYEGEKGIQTVLWDSLRCHSGLLRATFSMSELQDIPGLDEINRYRDERVAKGLRMQVIRSASRDTQNIWATITEELRELRFTPPELTVSMTTLIYDNNVALISSTRENYGLIIESEEFARFQGTLFEALWRISLPA